MILFCADNLNEGYNYLRAVVMAYGDISPESPLSLTSGSQQTTQATTSASTSERTTPQPNTDTPSLLYNPFEKPHDYPYAALGKGTLESIQNMSKTWFRRGSSQSELGDSRPISGGDTQQRHGSRTPVSTGCSVSDLPRILDPISIQIQNCL